MRVLSKTMAAGMLTMFSSLSLVCCQSGDRIEHYPQYGYVGSYLPNGHGVYLLSVDKKHQVKVEKLVSALHNAAQMAISVDGKYLYVASEVNDYNHLNHGSITAYTIDRQSGELSFLNQVSSQGAKPVYLSIHPSNQYLLVANYGDGSLSSYKIRNNGYLTTRISVKKNHNRPKKKHVAPEAAVEGSFANSDHDGSHAHMIQSSPDGLFAISTDLGLDRIYQWKLKDGKFIANKPEYINASSIGAGPRHFVFHPNGLFVYLINEESSTITVYNFDQKTGLLSEQTSYSSLPKEYKGTSYASAITLSRNGENLYIANRLHNSIAHFRVNNDGTLKPVDFYWTHGDYPRDIELDPFEKYLYVTNQRSDNIAQFKVEKTGKLTFNKQIAAIGSPSQIVFIPPKLHVNVSDKSDKKEENKN